MKLKYDLSKPLESHFLFLLRSVLVMLVGIPLQLITETFLLAVLIGSFPIVIVKFLLNKIKGEMHNGVNS